MRRVLTGLLLALAAAPTFADEIVLRCMGQKWLLSEGLSD